MKPPYQEILRRQDSVKDTYVPQDIIWKIPFNIHQVFFHHINDDRIKPTGSLQMHLYRSVDNWPEEVKLEMNKSPCCKLYWWSTGRNKVGYDCIYCKNCHVILCKFRIFPFHKQPKFVGLLE